MAELITLTDQNLDQYLNGTKPVVLIFADSENGLRGDFTTALTKATTENADVIFAKIDPKENPKAAERFEVGGKAVMIGWYCGQELTRRSRPWGTDLPGTLEALNSAYKADNPAEVRENAPVNVKQAKGKNKVDDKPVTVTDETFEAEVLDHELPVLVDFWAEWCGPCRAVAPALEKLAKEFAGQIRIAKVNVDENPGLSQTFRVMSIPNIMIFKQRTLIFNQPGALPEAAFRDLIQQAIALQIPPQNEQTQPAQ